MSTRPPRQHQPRQAALPGLAGDGRSPTVVDLFCGAGGLSEGFQSAGFHVAAGSDHDPDAVATYATNFPAAAALCGDVRDPSLREELDAAAAGADVLVGGPPCQAFSQVRNHSRLIEDPRNSLYREFVSAVGAACPDVFLMENVPGMAQMGVVDQVVTDLSLDGQYAVRPQLVDAADFGVPQSRKRLLFLGVRSSLGIAPPLLVGSGITSAVQLLRFTEASPAGSAGSARRKFSVEEGLERAESLVIDLTGGLAPGGDANDEDLLAAAAARRGPQAAAALAEGLSAYYAVAARPDEAGQMLALALADPEDVSAVTSSQAISDLAHLAPGRRDEVIAVADLPGPLSAYQRLMRAGVDRLLTNVSVPRIREDTSLRLAGIPAGGNHRDLAEHLQARYLTDTRWGPSNGTGRLGRAHYYAYRRLHPDMFAWTLNTKGDSVYHYSAARCLSVREFSRLQSFPDNFTVTTDPRRGPLVGRVDGGAAHSRYRQVGNAVPPLLAAAAAAALGDVLRAARGQAPTTETRLTQQRTAVRRPVPMVRTGTGELFGGDILGR